MFFLSLFLEFLNAKPNTLQGVLASEKEKTDRQGYEFSVQDLKVENLNTYNDFFLCYKDFIEKDIIRKHEEFSKIFYNFQGFIMKIKGDVILGKLPDQDNLKELLVNRGKKFKAEYHNELTVSFKKRI